MAGSSVSRASLRAAGMPHVRQVSEAPLSDRLREWMPHHTPGTDAGRRLRRKRNFRRRAGTDPDRAQALCGKRTGRIRTVSGSGKEAAGIPLLTAPSQGYFRMRGVFRSGSIRQDKPGEHSMKTWLITGCSSGLGKGLAEAVLEHGDQAVVTARRPETLRHFTDRYPRTALALPLDVSDDAQAEAAVKAALARFGRVDVLASVAGYCLCGAVEECSMDEIHRQFETNFFGTVRMIRKVLPSMRAVRNGAIVCFSSIAAAGTSPGSRLLRSHEMRCGGHGRRPAEGSESPGHPRDRGRARSFPDRLLRPFHQYQRRQYQ